MRGISFLSIIILFTVNSTNAQIEKCDKILGIWLSENKDGKIEVYKSNNKYSGKLIWGKNMYEADGKTSRKDDNNTDAILKVRDLKDLIILTDFIFSGDEWNSGKIYDPQSGKTYSCTMSLKDNKLFIRGYVGISWFGRTSVWTRSSNLNS